MKQENPNQPNGNNGDHEFDDLFAGVDRNMIVPIDLSGPDPILPELREGKERLGGYSDEEQVNPDADPNI